MNWHFTEWPPQFVEAEVTQEDQFRNEEVDLSATLVRETIQNSLDARANDGPAKVKMNFVSNGAPEFLQHLFERQLPHAEAAHVDLSGIDFGNSSALIIEDFGTIGLTGAFWGSYLQFLLAQ